MRRNKDPVFTGFCRGKQKHESDLTTILTRAKAFGVEKIIVTGGNLEESRKALIKDNESGALPELFSTVGVHPTRCSEFEADPDAYFAELLALCEQGKHDGRVVAIREFSGADQVAYNRNTGGDLHAMISKNRSRFSNGVVHSFTDGKDEMLKFVELGLYIGVNGCSLKIEENLDCVKAIPLERLMIETDAP
ncbi:unnamed protein product [Peronospora destructor]|uniref:TatD related DNase n=1 Tax=Peronospora destructor TaxID=86335 RepID=A0AAV0TUN2_9STRA|nr:unnamed protein product [Peronospora destructor]